MKFNISSFKQNPNIQRILDIGFVRKVRVCRAYIINLIKYRSIYAPPKWIISMNRKVAYLNNPKVAGTSITASLMEMGGLEKGPRKRNAEMGLTVVNLERPEQYFKFTYVRNPFERLVSCYENRVHQGKSRAVFETYLGGYLRKDAGFEDFVKKINRIPYIAMEQHFKRQSDIVYDKKGRCRVDHIGKFEDLQRDYAIIQKRYVLGSLQHRNKSKLMKKSNWMDYYTLETASVVWKKYKRDFEIFGYESEYKKLLEYIQRV